jgi:hypothetical protein
MTWRPPQQRDLAHHGAGSNPLDREWLALLILAQKPELALHHQGNAWGKIAVVVELLTRPQLQWLQGLGQNSLAGLRELVKRTPPINHSECCGEFQGSEVGLNRHAKQH